MDGGSLKRGSLLPVALISRKLTKGFLKRLTGESVQVPSREGTLQRGSREVASSALAFRRRLQIMGTEEDARKLFVAGLPDTVTDDGLRALFTGTGSRIDELSLPRDRATGRPRGFAFVTLSSAEDAQRSREQLDGSLLEGRSISVRPFSSGPPRGPGGPGAFGGPPGGGYAPGGGGGGGGGGGFGGGGFGGAERRPPPRDDSNRTLYVGNLPYDIEETDLRALFAQMGAKDLDRVHLPMDHATGRKRGFAFVSFISEDAAKLSLEVLGNLTVRGRPCTVHLAHPRGERPARPERSFGGPGGGPGGPGGPSGFRSSPPPAGGGMGGPRRTPSFGPPSFGGPGAGRPPPRRAGDEEGAARTAKGVSRKKRLEEEKKRGGGNARRYMDELDDDE
jgi:nucleolin